jgi:hypothetical protein
VDFVIFTWNNILNHKNKFRAVMYHKYISSWVLLQHDISDADLFLSSVNGAGISYPLGPL